jgi:hypothetical protein
MKSPPFRIAASVRLLDDQRYFVVVGALCEGVFDTDDSVLMAFNEK